MVKIHLWKSELAYIIFSLDYTIDKFKPTGIVLESYKDVRKKLQKAYNIAER